MESELIKLFVIYDHLSMLIRNPTRGWTQELVYWVASYHLATKLEFTAHYSEL